MNDMAEQSAVTQRRKRIVDHIKSQCDEIDHPAVEAVCEELFETLDAIKLIAKGLSGSRF